MFASVRRQLHEHIAPVAVSVLLAVGFTTATVASATPAHAATCGTSWTNAAGGDWSTAANWSHGVPTSSSTACITLAGTYEVTVQTSVSAKSLSLGGGSGTQTLTLEGECGQSAVLSLSAASTVNANGVLQLTDGTTCGNYAADIEQTAGTLTNAGTIHALYGNGTSRYLDGNITNNGAVQVDDGVALDVTTGSFVDGAGGSITAAGTGHLLVDGASYTQGNGTTSGTQPVLVHVGALHYNGSGGSTVTAYGNSTTIDGNIAVGQTLTIEGTCGEHGVVDAAANWTNAGTINLTDDTTCGDYYADLEQTAGRLANSGTIHVVLADGTDRYLDGNIANAGTIQIDNGAELRHTIGALTNGAGTIAAAGNGFLLVDGASYTQGVGTTSGSQPVLVHDGALHYNGNGASTITQYGNSTTIDGNIVAGQTLTIEGTCGEHGVVDAAANWTNAGTINLTDNTTCGDYYADLEQTAGTLTNTGTIHAIHANGTDRYLDGNVTNNGTIQLDKNVELQYDTGSLINGAKGTIAATGNGFLLVNGASYTQGLGTTSGTHPVLVHEGALHYTSNGASTVTQYGSSTTIDGNIAVGQTLTIEGVCDEHGVVTASSDWTNAGTIDLTDATTCGDYFADLEQTVGTLTNTGTIHAAVADGTDRYLDGNVVNNGTIQLDAGVNLQMGNGTLTNGAKGTIATQIASPFSYGRITSGEPVVLSGTLSVDTRKTPGRNAVFDVISCSKCLKGQFTTFSGLSLANGNGYRVVTTSSGVTLTVLKTADLTLMGSAPSSVSSRSTFSYTFTASNAGPNPAPNATLTTNLPAGVTFAAASPSCTVSGTRVKCALGAIASGGTATVTITVVAGSTGTVTTTATLASKVADPTPNDESASVKVKVV